MPTYTKVAKPTDSTYTPVRFVGKEVYDDVDLTYDDSVAFYDSVNQSIYSDMAKPIGGGVSFQLLPGMSIGLLIPLTFSQTGTSITTDQWVKVAKPI